jgi:hypothetical protein
MYNLIVWFGLFVVIVLSVEQVAIVVGQLENVSKIGNCALFSNLSTINLNNEQIACKIVS